MWQPKEITQDERVERAKVMSEELAAEIVEDAQERIARLAQRYDVDSDRIDEVFDHAKNEIKDLYGW